MRATSPAPLNLLHLITLIISGEATSYEAPHCAGFYGTIPQSRLLPHMTMQSHSTTPHTPLCK
jgi:hypothetical protein